MKILSRRMVFGAVLATAGCHGVAALAQDGPRLGLPIACEPGRTCFVQNYVDVDPGPGVTDFACGAASYNGHDGTDFRVVSVQVAAQGVAVLAAAAGTVKGVRDGMPDQFVTAQNRSLIANRECGNGTVIDHGGGWETQYCHMRQGSLSVKQGDRVEQGTPLGNVGFSGMTEFAHVHLTVRKDGKPIDPFTASAQTAACEKNPAAAQGLWQKDVAARLSYRTAEIIAAGFSGTVPVSDRAEIGNGFATPPSKDSAQLVIYARIINMRSGDRLRISASGPDGFRVDNETAPLDRNKATYMAFAGRKLTRAGWPAGTYTGTVAVVRDGGVISQQPLSAEIGR